MCKVVRAALLELLKVVEAYLLAVTKTHALSTSLLMTVVQCKLSLNPIIVATNKR